MYSNIKDIFKFHGDTCVGHLGGGKGWGPNEGPGGLGRPDGGQRGCERTAARFQIQETWLGRCLSGLGSACSFSRGTRAFLQLYPLLKKEKRTSVNGAVFFTTLIQKKTLFQY